MPSIKSVANLIANSGVPALFLDTCNFLDIVRLAMPNRSRPGEAEAVMKLLKLANEAPPSCLLVISSLIHREWLDNVTKVYNESNSHLVTLERQSVLFHDACQALGISIEFGRTRYAGLGLLERLLDLSQRLLNVAICIDADNTSRLKAINRVIDKIPPASVKQEVKDCTILEEYLAVSSELKAIEYQGKRVFCTSNRMDYCMNSKLNPVLADEFAEVGLAFAETFSWAIHAMNL